MDVEKVEFDFLKDLLSSLRQGSTPKSQSIIYCLPPNIKAPKLCQKSGIRRTSFACIAWRPWWGQLAMSSLSMLRSKEVTVATIAFTGGEMMRWNTLHIAWCSRHCGRKGLTSPLSFIFMPPLPKYKVKVFLNLLHMIYIKQWFIWEGRGWK